jgi:hypothetical protein
VSATLDGITCIANASSGQSIDLKEASANGSNNVTLGVPANLAASRTYTTNASGTIPGLPDLVKLTADQTFNSTTTLANVNGLSFAVTSGQYYRFSCYLTVQSDTATSGLKIGLTTPTFTIFSATGRTLVAADGVSSEYQGAITSSGDSVAATDVPATATDYLYEVVGNLLPSATGTLQVQAAEDVAAGNVKVRNGSNCLLTDLGP